MFETGADIPDATGPQIVVALAGGLSLFLLGLLLLTESLKGLAEGRLPRFLRRVTKNRFLGAASGASVAALLQSSSAASVLVVSLLSAGLLSLEQSLALLIGANVGTTVTAQLLAFDLGSGGLVLAAGGLALLLLLRGPANRRLGSTVFALGLVFSGMALMSEAAAPLRDHEGFRELLAHVASPLPALLAGAAFTAVVQSSSATVGVVIVLAGQGLLSLETSIALLFGANVGTCFTAGLAALGKPRPALQAAVGHLIFNLIGVVLWLPFIAPLAGLVRELSPSAPQQLGPAQRLAEELPRQVANAHLIFNLVTALLLLGSTVPLARLVRRIVPDRRA